MRILTVMPRCSNGRMMRATHARALFLLFKHIRYPRERQPTSCQCRFQCYTSPSNVGHYNVENSTHWRQPSGIRVPSTANAGFNKPARLVVFPTVSIGHEELPTLGALSRRGSTRMDHRHRKHRSQGVNRGFYSCSSLPCFIVMQSWDFLQKQPLVQTLLVLMCSPNMYDLVVGICLSWSK